MELNAQPNSTHPLGRDCLSSLLHCTKGLGSKEAPSSWQSPELGNKLGLKAEKNMGVFSKRN